MRAFEPVILHQVDIYLAELFKSSQGPKPRAINMTDRLKHLSLDIVCLLVFGRSLDVQTDPEFRFVKDEIVAENYFRNLKLQFPLLVQLGIAGVWQFLRNLRGRQNYRKLAEKLINAHPVEYVSKNTELYSPILWSMNTKGVQNHTQTRKFWTEALPFLSMGRFFC